MRKSIKRTLYIFLCAVLITVYLPSVVVAIGNTTFSLDTSNYSGSIDLTTQETISIPVNVSAEDFYSAVLTVEYDSSVFESVTATLDESFAGELTQNGEELFWEAENPVTTEAQFLTLTFVLMGDAAIGDTTIKISGSWSDSNYEEYDVATEATLTLVRSTTPEAPVYTDDYYVTIGTSTDVVQNDDNDTVIVTVDVNGLVESYNSATIVLNYNADLLTFKSGECNKTATVEEGQEDQAPAFSANNGTLTIRDFGGALATGGTLYTLTFSPNKGGTTEISLESAGFSTLEEAESGDLAEATCDENVAAVTIQHKVTVDGVASYVTPGEAFEYTILNYDAHDFEYNLTVTKDGNSVTAPTIDETGKFTIESVDGELEITVTPTAITYYTVDWTDESSVLTAEVKVDEVAAGGSVSFDIPVNGTAVGEYTYTVKVNDGTIVPATQDSTNEGYITYTISGVNQNIAIVIVKEEITPEEVTVTIDGTGASDLVVKQKIDGVDTVITGRPVKVNQNSEITLVLNPEFGYKYTVKIGEEAATELVTEYTEAFTVSADTTITVTKEWKGADFLEASEYVQLNGKTMWLIKIKDVTAKIEGQNYTYDENSFFWSAKYSAYCYLVVADNTADDATVLASLASKIAVIEGDATDIDYNGNVNKSMDAENNELIDVNDAQLVWNMYSAVYSDFTATVTVEKFLRADMDNNVGLNVNDALAVIAKI